MLPPKIEINPSPSEKNLLQDLSIEQGADKLFEQMISPSAQKPAINTPIRKHKNVVKGSSSRWNKDKETHLKLYLNQYGNDLDLVQGFFPGFSREFLQKKLEKINNNLTSSTPATADEQKLRSILDTTGFDLELISMQFPSKSETEIKELYAKVANRHPRQYGQDQIAANLPEKYSEYQNDIDARQNDIETDHFGMDCGTAFPNGYIYDMRGSQEASETDSYQDFIFGANDDDAFNFDYEKISGGNLFTPDDNTGTDQYHIEEGAYDADVVRGGRSNYFDGVDFEISEAFNVGENTTTAGKTGNYELEKQVGVKVNAFLNPEAGKMSNERGSDRRMSPFYEV
jgi:hypothetical protein